MLSSSSAASHGIDFLDRRHGVATQVMLIAIELAFDRFAAGQSLSHTPQSVGVVVAADMAVIAHHLQIP